jgi:ABC-type transporter lipoprotein component MlaA/pimeloyl-ACP methyl ester carboxylesterase
MNPPPGPEAFFPEILPDPLEPINRGVFAVNKGILLGVVQPTSRVYRTVVPQPARQSIKDFTRNITYPGRVVNHLLQGRWQGAGDESLRFLTNTTVGVAGLFDVASKWDMPKSDAHFGQTFHHWGWQSNVYLMLPFLGPSDDSHAAGSVADRFAEPWNYKYPYTIGSYVSSYDRLADGAEPAAQFLRTESDPYVGIKYIWSYASKEDSPDWKVTAGPDIPTLETLGVANIRIKDPKFIEKARELKVRLSSTGRDMKCNYWLQESTAPLVYISPGLGSHRLTTATLSVAESLYQNGFSVVTTTGLFHPEFMENASTSALPAYPPNDARDVMIQLTEFDQALEKKFPGAFGKRALVGFSMGGYQAIYLAAHEKKQAPGLMRFSRYVAINPPVNLRYGIATIDAFRDAPLAWPAEIRQQKIDNAIHKVAKIKTAPESASGMPFLDATESKLLIGSSFQLTLRDTIYSSQKRNDMGVLNQPISYWNREETYREISTYSFKDYFLRIVVPYYKTRGVSMEDFGREINLRTFESSLRAQNKVRVITNRNDFLLSSSDVSWLQSTFGSSRTKLFPNGGHLGNLAEPQVQQSLIKMLSDLK